MRIDHIGESPLIKHSQQESQITRPQQEELVAQDQLQFSDQVEQVTNKVTELKSLIELDQVRSDRVKDAEQFIQSGSLNSRIVLEDTATRILEQPF